MRDEGSSLAVDVYKQADEKQADDHVGAAIADERERHALVWQKRGSHSDIHAGLKGDHDHGSDSEEAADIVFGIRRDQRAAEADEQIG
jgi:hypothetical protein